MELRSQTFNKLVDILKGNRIALNIYKISNRIIAGAGVYEEGMEMEEMRNLADAMQISSACPQPPSVDPDLERVLLVR